MLNVVFPDVADVPGKRVLLLVDWHNSRFSLDLLQAMRSSGIYMFGLIPNCTSKMQPMDVYMFGKLKSKLDKLQSIYISKNKLEKLSRNNRIEIAAQATQQIFTKENIIESFKR